MLLTHGFDRHCDRIKCCYPRPVDESNSLMPPAVLQVNRESRTVALSRLRGILRESRRPYFANFNPRMIFFCFQTQVDTLLIPRETWSTLSCTGRCWSRNPFGPVTTTDTARLLPCPAEKFHDILQVLELECFFCKRSYQVSIMACLVSRFSRLQRLHLIVPTGQRLRTNATKLFTVYPNCDRSIQECLQVLKENLPDHQIPKVFYHGWRRRQSRSVFQQKNDARILPPVQPDEQ